VFFHTPQSCGVLLRP